jgi:2-polyprenyl-6-methoxyphenol hydroxylase-like FAD-dependent oxidoreductase
MARTRVNGNEPRRQTAGRAHAVVIGASMAGLLAARVLSETYRQVTILDRDVLPGRSSPRRGVPQSYHAHGLLYRGREILDELFPALSDEAVAHGALLGDIQADFRWCSSGHTMRQADSGLRSLLVSRPLLEHVVRTRVAAQDDIRILDGCSVVGLASTDDRQRVTGVRLRQTDTSDGTIDVDDIMAADLVVDASGRASRSPQCLEGLGYRRPRRDELHIGVAYASRSYRREPDHLDGDNGMVIAATPETPRAGVMLAQEGDRWIVTLAGYLGDGPPIDSDGYTAFAATLPSQDIHAVIRTAEPLDDPRPTRYPSSVRHRYEHLRRMPERFVVFGDAICTFNPIYGQGMTVAAAEALVLRDCLRRGTQQLGRRFARRAAKIVDIPWDIVVGGDLRFPDVEGRRSLKVRAINGYLERVHLAAASDPAVGRAFLAVANLTSRPERLLAPDIAARVIRGTRRRTTDTRTKALTRH